LHELLYEQTRDIALVWQQNPVTLQPQSEPQPDLTLLEFRADRYAHALPVAADVLLIVEVSDTTLDYDRGKKLRLYARHGVPEYWIVDLQAKRLEVYREPHAKGYIRKLEFNAQDTVSPQAMPEAKIAMNKVLS
jgi:Uma2 family endonuclease